MAETPLGWKVEWPAADAGIGLDRLLDQGLKDHRGFGHTQVGRLGPRDPW